MPSTAPINSAGLVEWVAQAIGFKDNLGEKGKSGILVSMSTRAEFLTNSEHRIRFVYTPLRQSDVIFR